MMNSLSGSLAEAYTGDDSPVKVEHMFTFKLDRSLRKMAEGALDIAKEYGESFRYIAVGIAAFLVLSGTARLVEAGGRGGSDSKRSSSSRSKDKTSKARSDTKEESSKK